MQHNPQPCWSILALLTTVLTGCVTEGQKRAAIDDVNAAFRSQYEVILAERGTRSFDATAAQSFAAMKVALNETGMTVDEADALTGYVHAIAPAPKPLTIEEWQQASETDLPVMKDIVDDHIGLMSWFVRFEPEGLEVIVNATVDQAGNKTEVALTARMRETAPSKSGLPRREYLPPTAVRMGLDKIWRNFDRALTLLRKGTTNGG